MSTITLPRPAVVAAGERPSWLDATVYPFRSRWLELDGSRVHYIDEGAGPPLLFLHANLMWSFTYRKLIRGLRHRFRCLALDYPGYGLSVPTVDYGFGLRDHAAMVARFVEALDLRDVTLYVNDGGGPIGLPTVVAAPERFRALIITDTFAWPLQGYPSVARFVGFVGGPIFRAVDVRTNLLLRATIRLNAQSWRLSPGERAAYLGPFPNKASRERIYRLFRDLVRDTGYLAELEQGLNRLRHLPALILYGEHDPVRKAGFQARFEQELPSHRSFVLPGAGHFVHEDAPDAIVDLIEAWWPETAASSASDSGPRAAPAAQQS